MKLVASRERDKIFLILDLGRKTWVLLFSEILLVIAVQSRTPLCPLEPNPEFLFCTMFPPWLHFVSVNDDRTNWAFVQQPHWCRP